MATYYARLAGNINASNVWATTPSGTAAAVTFASGDVLMANSFAITVNVSLDLGGTGQLRNDTTGGATGGGGFTLSDGITLTANIFGGSVSSTNCVTANPSTNVWIVGNITGGAASLACGLNNASGTGTINVTGHVTAGSSSVNATVGIFLGTATLIISGNVTGGAGGVGSQGEGVRVGGTGSCTITGLVTGGGTGSAYGVRAISSGNTTVVGQAIGGVAAPAINNEATGQVTVTRAVGNGFGGGSVGLSAAVGVSNVGSQSSITIVEQIEFGTLGQSPVNGRIRLKKMGTNVAVFNFCDTAGAKTLIDATQNAAMPAATDVRNGVSYASGALTGSAYIPAASSVASGVPVGSGTGTAVLTAAAIRTELAVELARIDAAISSRLAPSGTLATVTTLTNAPTVPTAAAIADEVRVELATELARIDAPISGAGNAPSAATVATAVRSELATELARVDVATSSRLASSAYSAAPTTAQIATAVEGSLLNEADGQAVLNAIVGAIGNQNLSEVSLVAAVRADLERVGGKIDSIPTTTAPSASTVAGAVRTELGTELGRIDAAVSSRLASASYTAPTAAPTAAANASAVRSELATELARVDAAVSTRLASSAYTAPANSDVAAIKAKTDALNTERLANVATTAIVGNLIAQANS